MDATLVESPSGCLLSEWDIDGTRQVVVRPRDTRRDGRDPRMLKVPGHGRIAVGDHLGERDYWTIGVLPGDPPIEATVGVLLAAYPDMAGCGATNTLPVTFVQFS